MFTVATPAASKALTTLDTVKSILKITTDVNDDFIDASINSITDQVCSYLRVPRASDGTVTLGLESLVQTFRFEQSRQFLFTGVGASNPRTHLILARKPVISITSVVIGTATLDPSEYEVDGASGLLSRLRSDHLSSWHNHSKILVAFDAGWLLPNDTGRNLPFDIEDCVISLIKGALFERDRDPQLKLERFLNRTYEYEVFPTSGDKTGGMPADVAAVLDRYRYFG